MLREGPAYTAEEDGATRKGLCMKNVLKFILELRVFTQALLGIVMCQGRAALERTSIGLAPYQSCLVAEPWLS